MIRIAAECGEEGRSLVSCADVGGCEMHEVRVLAAAVFRGVRAVGGVGDEGRGEAEVLSQRERRSGFEAEQRWEMLVAEPFGQCFAQLLARLDAAREPPEAERSEAGRAIWSTGTRLTYRLTADVGNLVRQVAGQAVVEQVQQLMQAFLAVLRVIQSHGVAIEVAGVGCQSTAVAEHSGEDAGTVGGEPPNGFNQGVGRESGGIEAILSLLVVTQFNAFTQLIVDTVVREARQPYEHLVDVARRPGGRVSGVVTRLVVIIETFEKNPERILGVFIRVEDTFEIADKEHVTGERGAGVRTDVRVPQLGGEGTEPVRHAVYHSRAWPGEALRPEAGECLVKRVKQTTDLMAVALRTGYVGEQSAERRVDSIEFIGVIVLGLGEQGIFFALTLPVLPPDLTADVLVERAVESVERGGQCSEHSALHVP
ncbi:hypothetical protein BOVATA_042760 [Babesia ovata]|uniref:Uncharacterized protein n=1 Tax=Babesia ovata TaxID=189622 RepID=A0A2H6KIG8_9APIC|nr:uncharacterized protein BOVATA_042760 [Babesia ovata]GBE62783.1 hypothetical protein BOVATA_042760 [Babesia ovata]